MAKKVSSLYKFSIKKSDLGEGYTLNMGLVSDKWWSHLASNQHKLFLMTQNRYIELIKAITKNYIAVEIEGSNPVNVQFVYPTKEDCKLAQDNIKSYINSNYTAEERSKSLYVIRYNKNENEDIIVVI